MAPAATANRASATTIATAPDTDTTEHLTPPVHHSPVKPARKASARPDIPVNYPVSRLQLDSEHCIDDVRELKVAVIGAGISGINAGILLPAKVPGINLTIFEKSADVAGTWLENVYPGVRCDIPAHVYQSTFAPSTQWSEEFATGAELRDYWQGLARKYDVYQYVKLRHLIEEASWDDADAKWTLAVANLETCKTTLEKFDFVIAAVGRFNAWKLPEYPGIDEYQGHLRHTSNYDLTFDPVGKNIAIIGNGASGVQIIPTLQKTAKHLTQFIRNPTWIAHTWVGNVRTTESVPIPEEQRKKFEKPEAYLAYRKAVEEKYWRRYRGTLRESGVNEGLRESFIEAMKQRVAKKPELLEGLIPDFAPHCRRLTPGPGYLEALTEDNVDLVKSKIKRFTATGIETEDGVKRDFDAIFCATGANTDMVHQFPIKARGVDLRDVWRPGGIPGFPYTYLGVATPGFPNLLFLGGPHVTSPSGTLTFSVETSLAYYAKILRKVSREGILSIVPSRDAADDFVDYCDAFFPTTVLTDNCASWSNGGRPGARIHGMWPGSGMHMDVAKREPRWEDWEYVRASKVNRFAYFGNGYTHAELDEDNDLVSYLRAPGQEKDLRDLHESWWDVPGAFKKTGQAASFR